MSLSHDLSSSENWGPWGDKGRDERKGGRSVQQRVPFDLEDSGENGGMPGLGMEAGWIPSAVSSAVWTCRLQT